MNPVDLLRIILVSNVLIGSIAQNCPYYENLENYINLQNIPDRTEGVIFDREFVTSSKVISVSILHADLSRILDPGITATGIKISTKQPEFTNMLDFEWRDYLDVSEADGLTISLENGTKVKCGLYLSIWDTNNQPPTFSRDKISYTIRSDWNKSIPLNVNFGGELEVADDDFSLSNAVVEILPGDVIRGNVTPIYGGNYFEYKYDVVLFLNDFVPGIHVVTATDGVNNGSIEVELIAENTHAPVFLNTGFFCEFESMPKINDPLPLKIVAVDPDSIGHKNISYNATGGFLDYSTDLETFVFTQIENLESKEIRLMASEVAMDGLTTSVGLSLKFPRPVLHNPRFPTPFFNIKLPTYPTVGQHVADLKAELQGAQETLTYQFGFNKPDFLGIQGNALVFTDLVSQSQLGINNKIVFDVKAVVAQHPSRTGSVTFVINFPITGKPTTQITTQTYTTGQPASSTFTSTTTQSTTQPSTTEPSTEPSTDPASEPPSTEPPWSSTDPGTTDPPSTDPGTSEPPPSSDLPPSTEPPWSSTDPGTTDPSSTNPTTSPSSIPTSSGPTTQRTTVTPPTISTNPSTTEGTTSSDCKTPEECGLCSTGTTCQCGLDEDSKCASSGLLATVIATTVLSVASTLLLGYLIWKRVGIDHTPFQLRRILSKPATKPVDNPRLSCDKLDTSPSFTFK